MASAKHMQKTHDGLNTYNCYFLKIMSQNRAGLTGSVTTAYHTAS